MKRNLTALFGACALASIATGASAQSRPAPQAPPPRGPHHAMIDADKDGVITRDEWMKAAAERFERFDVSKDGKISREEMRFGMFEEHGRRGRGGGRHRGGPGFGPDREGPGGPGHRFGPPPPGAPAPEDPAGN